MSTAEHAARFAQHDTAIEELRGANKVIFSKLDAIATAVHELRAGAGPSVQALMTMAAAGIVIICAYTGSVVYLARSGMSEDMQKLRDRQTRMETIMEMATGRPRPSPGAWVPDAAWAR